MPNKGFKPVSNHYWDPIKKEWVPVENGSLGEQSAEGINTETGITGDLWATDTWTGAGEQNSFNQVGVSLTTDEAGVLHFDFSVDGESWSQFPVQGFKVASGVHEFHTAVKLGRYFRPRFMGESGRSYFRLFTYYGNDFLPSNAPINQTAGLDQDATHVRPTDMQEEISLGRRAGVVAWGKFGHRSLLAAGGAETVWNTTGNYTPPTTATAMRIAYDGTGGGTTDGAGTNGAHTLRIFYIDSAGLPATLDHVLETDGSDDTVVTTLGINRIQVIAAGSDTFNKSEIIVTAVTGGAKLAVVEAETSITEQAIFHCGSNHKAVFKFLYIHMNKSSGGAASVQIKGFVFIRSLGVQIEVFRTTLDDSVEATEGLNPIVPFVVPETGVLFFTADTTRDGAEAVIRFSGNEYQNT